MFDERKVLNAQIDELTRQITTKKAELLNTIADDLGIGRQKETISELEKELEELNSECHTKYKELERIKKKRQKRLA